MRHLYIRAGYLALMMVVLVFVLLSGLSSSSLSMRDLASAGAAVFRGVSYLQVGLICLLTPVFMAGAIAQEANPKTWDILLTTPLNSLQVVLGNLFGRLFFIVALLFSTLPLFAVTQYFGGVPGDSIVASYAIAGTSSLLVAAIAVTLSVTRTAGKRAVFLFYISVVMYLFVTYALDIQLRQPIGIGMAAVHTTIITPLNPFLALKVLLDSNNYIPHDFTGETTLWFTRKWLAEPISTFCWLCFWLSMFMIGFSTIRLRVIGASVGAIPWYRQLFGLGAKGSRERPARHVGQNPISWRESTARGKTLASILARWSFVAAGVVLALSIVILYHNGTMTGTDLQLAIATVVAAEVVIIGLAALNMSATAVSREREDGTLDLILTTPIQPGPYLTGKLRGLVQFLVPMMLVPILTLGIVGLYIAMDGFGREGGVMLSVANPNGTGNLDLPPVIPESVFSMAIVLPMFIAFCVMVGLHWSIRSKGTIGSIIAAVGIVLATVGVMSLCAIPAGENLSVLGAWIVNINPINLTFANIYPDQAIPSALSGGLASARIHLIIGAIMVAGIYGVAVYLLHTNMKRTFMMTVRRLAGTN
ncbi:MAG: ABC transporter permease subunit [Planctomycetes bacterium]|nr:ABC transporter permease subunit [Planctomycetota bacterium]